MSIEERIQQLEANRQDPIPDGKPTFPSMKARTLACLITFHLFSN